MTTTSVQVSAAEAETIAYLLTDYADTLAVLARQAKTAATRVHYESNAEDARTLARSLDDRRGEG